ncbi:MULTISPECIES: flagellar basal body rod protein FlgC [Delftia]|jgi:flagellar basal-body rod protein FlgC|uniref:Flagellar basal-body rod protein FlgC n=1 Tax=Delftia acidovorans TaxID=80866 RepID=A0AAJ2R2Y9_DELAC|nr:MULTISPECIES: flagellar basal body rod protein FlgC [Delftia]EZP49874.1 Flagellar basal-body rod protein FlgC [Delftia sp. RIT313]KZK29034.1 flagellar basal body rod protein FlgC [Delftia sp. GW456-R20]MDR3018768.1 flagellar basal body rod protein FlgC [Delftia acidovorans]MDX4957184.1 flagellar basal body rod protein FlgC [Delftia acidovorans]
MDYSQAFAISASGMTLERTRVEVASLNLANANTVAGTDGKLFQPLRVVARTSFSETVAQGLAANPVVSLEPTQQPARMVYEPGHPMADARGFVSYAGVDTATEMVTMMSAMRAYEANVAAMNTARSMAQKALTIGGGA